MWAVRGDCKHDPSEASHNEQSQSTTSFEVLSSRTCSKHDSYDESNGRNCTSYDSDCNYGIEGNEPAMISAHHMSKLDEIMQMGHDCCSVGNGPN